MTRSIHLRGSLLLALGCLAFGAGCRPAALAGMGATSPLEAASVPGGKAAMRPLGSFLVIQSGGLVEDELRRPALACDDQSGDHLAVWQEKHAAAARVYAQRLSSDLTPLYPMGKGRPELPLTSAQSEQVAPVVAFDGQRFLAAWEDHRAEAPGVYARHIRRDGPFEGGEFRLGASRATAPALSTAAIGGNMLLAWLEDGRVTASLVGPDGPGQPATLAGAVDGLNFLAGLLGSQPGTPQVAADPAGGHFMTVWSERGEIKARIVEASGALGALATLGPGHSPALAFNPASKAFLAVYEHAGKVEARSLAADGRLGAAVVLGEGMSPVASYDQDAQAALAFWRSNGHIVRQKLDGSLTLQGAATLMPAAGARSVALSYNARAKAHVLALDERFSSFDRITLVRVR